MATGFDAGETHSLAELVRSVEVRRQTLTLLNFDGASDVLEALAEYFRNQNVELRRASTADRTPTNVVLLHRGDEFIASASLESVYDVVAGRGPVRDPESYETMAYPDVITKVDQTVFEGYDKRTMIGVSRGVEKHAWTAAEGELHAGFQRLSLLRDQYDRYASLADRGVEVHVYGEDDWSVPGEALVTHTSSEEELTRAWFVVFDQPAGERRALLARERVPDDFHGFWTTRDDAVDEILARLRDRFPPDR